MGIFTPMIQMAMGSSQLAIVSQYQRDWEYCNRYESTTGRAKQSMRKPSQKEEEHARMFESVAIAGAMGAMINTH